MRTPFQLPHISHLSIISSIFFCLTAAPSFLLFHRAALNLVVCSFSSSIFCTRSLSLIWGISEYSIYHTYPNLHKIQSSCNRWMCSIIIVANCFGCDSLVFFPPISLSFSHTFSQSFNFSPSFDYTHFSLSPPPHTHSLKENIFLSIIYRVYLEPTMQPTVFLHVMFYGLRDIFSFMT